MRHLLAVARTRILRAAKHSGLCERKFSPHLMYYYIVGNAIRRSKSSCLLQKQVLSSIPGPVIFSNRRNISTCTSFQNNKQEQADDAPKDFEVIANNDESLNKEEEGEGRITERENTKRKKTLFTKASSLSELTDEDINTYISIGEEDLVHNIGEGLPAGLTNEYEETGGSSLLIRRSFLELRDELKACAEKVKSSNAQLGSPRKHFILDGPVSSGKSITLLMLVHWARAEGWFVFYVPKAKEWTHGGFYYKNPVAPSWDTPVQAITVLKTLLKSHEIILQQLPCQIFEPIILGEGPGIGMLDDKEAVAVPQSYSLFDLVQTGLTCPHAAVGLVVRLRQELSMVKEVPVLFVIDQYNSWFTFSQYKEYTGRHSSRAIHARELTMVQPYRSMLHNDMMVAAYSHSTAVGKLRKHLPDTPQNARYDFPRYSIDEAEAVVNYYCRQNLISHERFSEDKWKRIYYLANGNGSEIRDLVRFI